jgi:hypothetical protein
MLSRDTGQSRVPAPPHIKTGINVEVALIQVPPARDTGPPPAAALL